MLGNPISELGVIETESGVIVRLLGVMATESGDMSGTSSGERRSERV